MTPIQTELQKIRERADKATPGPWYKDRDFPEVKRSHTHFIAISEGSNPKCQEDSQFIAHARTDIPKLLACVERLVEELEGIWEEKWYDLPASYDLVTQEEYVNSQFKELGISAILTGESEKGDGG